MAVLTGGAGVDRLRGGDADDAIAGLDAADVLAGGRGADLVEGGEANDRLFGGDGADRLEGGAGDDIVFGHGGAGFSAESGLITATRVGSFVRPLFATAAPGDPESLYVVQRAGSVRTLDLATNTVTGTFLEMPAGRVGTDGERGMLGLAFHPDHAANGWVFVSFINVQGFTEIVRFTRDIADPTRVDPASEQVIWTFERNPPFTNHNGGWIGFGPDGYLYHASGDGGGGNDPDNNAQNIASNLGKMHRLDVDGVDAYPDDPTRNFAVPADNPFVGRDGADEVWAIGLRNPWRNSFDRATGDLYIADVGGGGREEVSWQSADDTGGRNYGWVVLEGTRVNVTGRPGAPSPDDPSLIAPVLEYAHTEANGRSVTGGYVYRGPGAGLDGFYVYGDFVSGRIATFRVEPGEDGRGVSRDATDLTDRIAWPNGPIARITSFAEDASGALYVMNIDGGLFRLDPSAGAADGADVIDGGTGNDRLYGEAGHDVLRGGEGADQLSGGLGVDQLFGDAGADRLVGDRGRDTLDGGTGDDRLTGGADADLFVFGPGGGADRVFDFEPGLDTLDLRAFDFADEEAALARAVDNRAGNVLFRFEDGSTLLIAGATKAELIGDLLI